MTWPVQAARITIFPLLASGSSPKSALDLYKAIWGKDPDSFQGPMAGSNPFPGSVAQGAEGNLNRVCQTQPIRTDLTFGPAARTFGPDLATIEDTVVLHAEMKKVFGTIDVAFQGTPLNRVAVYLQLGREAANIPEANKILSSTVWQGKQVALTNEEDFILQFNCPRPDARDPTTKLNFITKWSVERLQMLTFLAGVPAAVGATNTSLVVEKIVPTVAFDNSNMPLQKPFDPGETTRILSELFAEVAVQLKACNMAVEGF